MHSFLYLIEKVTNVQKILDSPMTAQYDRFLTKHAKQGKEDASKRSDLAEEFFFKNRFEPYKFVASLLCLLIPYLFGYFKSLKTDTKFLYKYLNVHYRSI